MVSASPSVVVSLELLLNLDRNLADLRLHSIEEQNFVELAVELGRQQPCRKKKNQRD